MAIGTFQNFYPQHGREYEYILHNNCSQEFANYLTGRPQDFKKDWLGGGGKLSVLVQLVVNCLLENTSEYVKAAASTTPLLSLLISFGSPSVYMERVFDFRQPERMLQRSLGRYRLHKPDTAFKQWVLTAMQYIVALGALGVGTVYSWWSNTIFAPLVWTILSIPIHLAEEKSLYITWSWLLSTATAIHILFGSLVLSGLLFIGTCDALVVIFRYVLSVLLCHRYVPEPDEISAIEVVRAEGEIIRYRRGAHKV
ncbi:hypothetical protein F5Y09DRAFT_353187 [Xylaria sp. FL1042]|nr:hypothetical protein F5Y09DRAFT_353187 [Xylaria sp. FL1042]